VECRVGDVTVNYVQHGEGRPVLVLHGAGVDHREAEACFEPALGARGRYRRTYPDLPGMGRTPAPARLRTAEEVRDILLAFADDVAGPDPLLLVGHSAGAHYARGIAARRPDRVAGLALICPLVGRVRDVPAHRPVVASADLGDDGFRGYFVVQTPEMLDRYDRFVAPAIPLADDAALERIGRRWELRATADPGDERPTVIVAGRQDSVVGYAAAVDLLADHPRATIAVLDGAGHALPHEQPDLLAALLGDWLARVERAGRGGAGPTGCRDRAGAHPREG
jgi:pimeloyl-ACP methyl ester carboxylesterase